MNTITLNNQYNKQIEYDKNLKKLLGHEISTIKKLERYAGILKGKLSKNSVTYQREIRKGWDNKIKKLGKK